MQQLNNQSQALSHWLNARKSQWESLENTLKPTASRRAQEISDARQLLSGYRALLSDLSLSRRVNGKAMITRYLENLFLKAHEEIYGPANHPLARLIDLYHWEIPRLMRELKTAIFSAFALFVLGIAAGWWLIGSYPDLIGLLASPKMIDHVQKGELWTDGLLNVAPSSVLSLSIAANNITVTLFAFGLGAFYGVGTLYIIGFNGFMLGGIFAFTAAYQLDGRLFAFIIGHGVVELSVIIIAGAMGLQLGEALIRPGARNRLQAFQETSISAGKVLLAVTPFLIFAGLIEGFVSPDQAFNLPQRAVIGCCSGMIFWLILLFGVPGKSRQP
ncbi:stage II sporulation protein M [Methylomonas sp. OY6]|uniref:Stage II sporulation protein M n=1 Tax=Methylomonas defluvii TaxID=3045149 RepID=A0ABU4UHR4_9GAMM|nr:stage II sporulation protein M [Methylomonas sp. OY6]MDX8128653.1 stage II sporulation protein M [Methylomonas sp. OY6]